MKKLFLLLTALALSLGSMRAYTWTNYLSYTRSNTLNTINAQKNGYGGVSLYLYSTNAGLDNKAAIGCYNVTTTNTTSDMTCRAGQLYNNNQNWRYSYVETYSSGTTVNGIKLFKINTGYIRVKRPNGRLYVFGEVMSSGGADMVVQIGSDDPLTGEYEYINVAGKCPANHSSSYYRYESSSANSDGYMVRISAAQSKGSTWDWKAFAGYNTSSWIKKNNSVIEIDDASGKRWTEGGVDYFNVDYISTTRKVYHITNYPTDHIINATSVKCYKDETNGEAVMEVSDGIFTGTFNFAFDAFDNNVTIPAGTYTIGTDMNGQIYTANNSYSLTSGALTISKSGSNIIITTASVLQSSEPVNNFTLSANLTPTKSDMIFIEADLALLQVSNSSGNLISTGGGSWFHLVGVDNTYLFNIETAGIPFAVRSFTDSEIDTGTEYTNFSENGNNISLDISQTRMTFSTLESKDMHNIYDVNAQLVSSSGTYYFIHANAIRQLQYDEGSDAFPLADMNLPNCSVVTQIQDDYDSDYSYAPSKETNPGLWLVSSQTEVNGYTPYARLAFKVNGNSIPTGAYNIRTSADGTMMVGDAYPMYKYDDMAGWPSENRGSAVVLDKDGSSWWYYLQTGTIYVSNISNNYYADIYGTTSTGSYVHFTMGAEPPHRTVIINEDDYVGGHTVEASTAFCLNDECTEFWQNMKIILTPHPRGGSTFTGWTGVNQGDIVDNGDGTYTFTVGARDYNNVSATFSSSTPTYTVTYNAGANGTGDAIADDTKEAGEPLTLSSSTYTRTGYTQTGWSVNLDGSTNDYALGGTYSTDADLDLYPYWEINKYTVTVTTNPSGYGTVRIGSGAEQAQVQIADVPHFSTFTTPSTGTIVINGTTVTATPATVAGYTYTFQNWTNALATVTDDMDVTANFTRSTIPYTITYNLNGGTNPVSPAPVTSYNVESATITLPTPTKEGHNFLGWYANSDLTTGGVVTTIPVGSYGNKEFWAKWEAKTYAITYNAGANGTGTIAAGEKTYNVDFILSSSTFTRTGYTQTGWSTEDGGSKAYDLGETYTGNTALTLYPYWEINTYTVTIAKNEDDWGTISATSVANVPYGTVISNNGTTVTINGTTVTATPAANDAQYSYAFSGWTNGAATVTGNMTVTANFTRTTNTYDITFKNADGTTLKKSDGTTDAVYSVAYSATPAYDGATPTKAADSEYTYTFNAWSPAITSVTGAATYTATYSTTKVQYTLTWDVNGGNTLTGTYTNGTMDWGTAITKPADPTKSGYTFTGWDADNDGTADDVAATMPTSDVTYKALWTAASPNITLCENCNDAHYNTFKATYGGSAGVGVNVTYNRQFTASRWSTMCLPFSLDLATMIANKMYGCVYEFKYATGNANVGSGVNLYFSNAKSIEAGTCYIVNANSALAEKTSFVFRGVTIDLSKDNGAALTSVEAYNNLPGYKSEGTTIELVGTLRNGTLQGSAKDNTYMGLKNNMIYYPNTTYPGSTIWAYRGIFRSTETLNIEKMRIVVDGEDRGELIIDADGELLNAGGDAPSRKFIRDGVLYIEREGVIYDAQGKRIK